MTRKKLIVVHGMGQHDENSLRDMVVAAFERAFAFYPSLQNQSVDDRIDIVPVAYNNIFEMHKQKIAQQSGALASALSTIGSSLPLADDTVSEINAIGESLGNETFFNTHLLDVILYRFTLLSEPVRLKLAEALALAIAEVGAGNVHVMGHSLGTAVVHDTLAKCYGPDPVTGPAGPLNLHVGTHKLAGVHLVANVSRVLQSFIKVGSSTVRPGPLGCTSNFAEYRHILDPFTRVRPFDPTDNLEWVTHDVWESAYLLSRPTTVTEANVHSFSHYLINPLVHAPLFKLLFGHRPKKQERDLASEAYLALADRNQATALREAIEHLTTDGTAPIKSLLMAGIALKNVARGFGESM